MPLVGRMVSHGRQWSFPVKNTLMENHRTALVKAEKHRTTVVELFARTSILINEAIREGSYCLYSLVVRGKLSFSSRYPLLIPISEACKCHTSEAFLSKIDVFVFFEL